MKHDESQVYLLNKVADYIKTVEKRGIDSSSSSLCYFPTWTNDPGLIKLKLWIYGYSKIFSYFKIFLRNFLSVAKYSNINIKLTQDPNNFKKIIVSFATKNSFQSNGSFTDRLLSINSNKNKEILWFLVSADNYVPKNLENNLCIIIKSKDSIFNYGLFFIKTIFKTLFQVNYNINNFVHQILCDSIYAKLVSSHFIRILKQNNINLIFMPYEGQPFNNHLISQTKNYDKKIKIIGYHSAIPPLPTNMIYRKGAPDKLIISGTDQFHYLNKYLNWNSKKLKISPSLRFKNNNSKNFNGLIYLPYVIFNYQKVLILFEKLIINKHINMQFYFELKNHPLCTNSDVHIKLMNGIEEIYKKYKIYKNNKVQNKSIFIGPTSAVIESLANGIDVYHICVDPVFEAYSRKIWPNILVNEISDNIFHYKLIKGNKTIILGDNDKLFDNNYINE